MLYCPGVEWGNAAEWVAAVATTTAILVTGWQFKRQHQAQLSDQRRRQDEHDRSFVAGVSAWIDAADELASVPSICLNNSSASPIYEWRAYVVPSGHFPIAASISAGDADMGPLQPSTLRTVQLANRPPVTNRRAWGADFTVAMPRFVVFRFSDAIGREWVRSNNFLRRLPEQAGLWDSLLHLRNFRLDDAGELRQDIWEAAQVGLARVHRSTQLPRQLSELVVLYGNARNDPFKGANFWIEPSEASSIFDELRRHRPINYGESLTVRHRRPNVSSEVQISHAYDACMRFFSAAAVEGGVALFIKGD